MIMMCLATCHNTHNLYHWIFMPISLFILLISIHNNLHNQQKPPASQQVKYSFENLLVLMNEMNSNKGKGEKEKDEKKNE
mmetsp:Transcript_15109/g.23689  ORF Transcript_15109/g.23689 Transcript_15109/m.23689 type:complete len:80 (+) Transcript_15109:1117-1356(+)